MPSPGSLLSAKVAAGTFWFVAYVVSASYTANLTAFLTVSRLSTDIGSIADLADQNTILYGTVSGTQLYTYFKHQDQPLYKKMFLTMEEKNTFVPNTTAGVDRVRNGEKPYALIYDNLILEYIANNRPCNTLTVGETFRKAGYGIALRPGVKYTNTLSLEILRLRQEGLIDKLKDKWINTGTCPSASTGPEASSGKLSLENMSGIFLVFAVGIGLALIILVIHAVCIKRGCAKKLASDDDKSPDASNSQKSPDLQLEAQNEAYDPEALS